MRQNETPFAYHHFFSSFFVQDSLSLSCLSINHIMNDLAVNFRQWNKLYANIVNIKYEAKKTKKFYQHCDRTQKKKPIFFSAYNFLLFFILNFPPSQHPKHKYTIRVCVWPPLSHRIFVSFHLRIHHIIITGFFVVVDFPIFILLLLLFSSSAFYSMTNMKNCFKNINKIKIHYMTMMVLFFCIMHWKFICFLFSLSFVHQTCIIQMFLHFSSSNSEKKPYGFSRFCCCWCWFWKCFSIWISYSFVIIYQSWCFPCIFQYWPINFAIHISSSTMIYTKQGREK